MNRWLPAILITVILISFRLAGSYFSEAIPNLQPLLALVLCSFVFLKGWQRAIPFGVWLVTDPMTSRFQNNPVFGIHHLAILAGVLLTVGIAYRVCKNPTLLSMMAAASVSAVSFYLITNLLSFAVDPLYAKNWHGFIQSQWTGPTGYGPTWVFLRNLLAGNLLFTGLFLLARQPLPAIQDAPVKLPAR